MTTIGLKLFPQSLGQSADLGAKSTFYATDFFVVALITQIWVTKEL